MKTEKEWLECEVPGDLIRALMNRSSMLWWNGISREPSDRKLRLFSLACMEIARGKDWSALDDFLMLAETGEAPTGRLLSSGLYCSALEQATAWCQGHPVPPVREQKLSILRDVLGNPFRYTWRDWKNLGEGEWMGMKANISVRAAPTWLTPKVKALAQLIYDEADFASLPILADMLEDEGCDCEETLKHLRGLEPCPKCMGNGGNEPDAMNTWDCGNCNKKGWIPLRGSHFRGCWALDLLMGKG